MIYYVVFILNNNGDIGMLGKAGDTGGGAVVFRQLARARAAATAPDQPFPYYIAMLPVSMFTPPFETGQAK